MKELVRILRPVRLRIRWNRFRQGAVTGLLMGLSISAVLAAIALWVPVAGKAWMIPGITAGMCLICAVGNGLRPVSLRMAAGQADACGMKERAVTALELAEKTEREEPFRSLQLTDARSALRQLRLRDIRMGAIRKRMLASLITGAVLAVLCLIPGEGDRQVARQAAFREELRSGMERVEAAAEEDRGSLPEKERDELRKLTDQLRRELEEARDETDALVALDRAEQRMESLRNRTSGDVAAALNEAAAQVSEIPQTEANREETGLTEQDEAADHPGEGQGSGTEGRQGMSGMLKALQNLKKAVSGLSGQTGSSGQNEQGNSGTASDQNGQNSLNGQNGLNGQNAQSGQNGQNGQGGSVPGAGKNGNNQSGSGAGNGSTNQEQGSTGGASAGSGNGIQDPRYKEGSYETIYDPERTEADMRDAGTNQNRLGEDSVQTEIGPGRGRLEGDVPYGQVIGEYAETAARAADNDLLTAEEKEWVSHYFSILTSQ